MAYNFGNVRSALPDILSLKEQTTLNEALKGFPGVYKKTVDKFSTQQKRKLLGHIQKYSIGNSIAKIVSDNTSFINSGRLRFHRSAAPAAANAAAPPPGAGPFHFPPLPGAGPPGGGAGAEGGRRRRRKSTRRSKKSRRRSTRRRA